MRRQRDGRWLLLGASGLVGAHLRVALAGRNVVVTSHRTPVPGGIALDVTDAAAVARVLRDSRPDVVVVTVAEHTERCERDPEATRLVNVDGLQRVADGAPDALLVVFSSEYVFDGRNGPYSEDDEVIPPTPAPDLARAVIELVDRSARGTFHVAGPEILPRPEFARRVAAAFGLDASLIDAVPTSELGLLAQRPLEAGLRTDKLRGFLGHGLSPSAPALAAMREAEPIS